MLTKRLALVLPAAMSMMALASPALAEESSGGMKSPAAFGVGVVLSGAGTAGLAVGGWLFSRGTNACDPVIQGIPTDAQIDACVSSTSTKIAGIISMVTGGAFTLAGVPIMIAGGIADSSPTAARVEINVAPTGGGFTVRF